MFRRFYTGREVASPPAKSAGPRIPDGDGKTGDHRRWRRPTTRARRRNQRLHCEALEGRQMLSGYYIINMESGLALDDTNFSTSNGNLMQQWQPTGGLNQRWNLVFQPDGNAEIVNAYSGKALDDTNWSTSNGTRIQQWQYAGGLNQQWRIVGLADGNDEIVNAYSGKVLDDTNFSTSNGTQIQQWQATGGINQQWKLLAAGNAPTVTNYVVDASSGKVLEDNGYLSNGTIMEQWQPTGGVNQRWTFISLADGFDVIVNDYTGKVLDDTDWSTSDGNLIQQWQATGGMNQQWELVALSDGTDEIVNAYSGKVLDDTDALTNNGNQIQQWQANGGVSEHWKLLAVGSAPNNETASIINANSGKALDDTNFSTSNGTIMQQWQPTGAYNQTWTFISLADGNDLIVNDYSGLVLDDPRSSTSSGTLIQQFQLNGGTNQQWYTDTLADGNVVIFNAASHDVLDDPSFSTSNGTQIQQWPLNTGTNQQWFLFVGNPIQNTTPNWSGYVAATSLTSPKQNSVTFVGGSWVVPRVTGPSSGSESSFTWVGIDGYGTGTVEQVGTAQKVINGVAHYYAWWEMWSSVTGQPAQVITSMTVEPGDSITGSVQYISSGTHAGQFELTITDTSRKDDSFTTYQTSSATQDPLATRSTAEWIVESPFSGGTYATLPDFGEVTFTNATAMINGVWGSINSSSWQSEALCITSNGESSGVLYDKTSTLTSSGTTFAVLYNTSGTGTSSSYNVKAMAKAGPAVEATLVPARAGSTMVGGAAGTVASDLSYVAPIDPAALDALFAESDSSHDDAPRVKGPADGQSPDVDVYLSILPASSPIALGDGGTGLDILGKRRIFGRA